MKGKLPTVPDTNHSVPACQEYSHSQLAITNNHATIQYVRLHYRHKTITSKCDGVLETTQDYIIIS